MTESDIFSATIPPLERRRMARSWLRSEQRKMLRTFRGLNFNEGPHRKSVTLVAYTFPSEDDEFDFVEFSIRQSWRCIGRLKTVIVADRRTTQLSTIERMFPSDIEIQIEPSLKPGDISSMSSDCIERLHERFSTPYCLIIQDDGFPINRNLDDFLGAYDYIGAPSVRDVPAQHFVDLTRCACLNGGFSLRSRHICDLAAKHWRFWRHLTRKGSLSHTEDVFYTKTACLNPLYRIKCRFPSSKIARRFSIPDFDGAVDIRGMKDMTFGVHGPTAIWQLTGGDLSTI